jgi:hypothetical protein
MSRGSQEVSEEAMSRSKGPRELPVDLEHLEERERAQAIALKGRFADQEYGLRQRYGEWILRILGAQLLVADAIFVAFAWIGVGWDLPAGVVEVWLVATVVQVVGVVAVVTRHLFPNRDERAVAS